MELDLTIFIPTYNRQLLLKRCISGIKKSLIDSGLNAEILVINESPVMLNLKETNVTVFNFDNEVLPCDAMYFALLNAKGRYFMRIDDDNEIDVHLISLLYNYIVNNTTVAYCGALGKREDGSISNPGTKFSKKIKLSLRDRNVRHEVYDVDLVDNVYIMNPQLIDLNKFRTSCKYFPWSFEDGFDQLRLKKLEYRICVLPDAMTVHHTHKTGINFKQVYHYGRSKFIMYRCIFKFSSIKTMELTIFSLLSIPYVYRTDIKNVKMLFLAYQSYFNGVKDAVRFIKTHKCLD